MPPIRTEVVVATLFVATLLTAGAALAQTEAAITGKAMLKSAEGAEIGTATFTQTEAGVLIRVDLRGLPPGEHGLHLHEVGECEPPFDSAGDHFNPTTAEHGFYSIGGPHAGDMPNIHVPDGDHFNPTTAEHGFYSIGGPHAGDMPNIHVPESGALTVEVLNTLISLESEMPETLFDDDGASILVHAHADDYRSQPSGESGDRIACGVVEK